jgi:hypothetical protein
MNDSQPVRFLKYIADFHGDLDGFAWREVSFSTESLGQRHAFDKFHHDELPAIG